jgi:hypothetical protein
MVQMAGKELLPAIMAYCGQLADSVNLCHIFLSS